MYIYLYWYIYTYIYTYIYVFFFYMQIIKACGHGSSHLGDCVHDGMPRASTRSQAHVMSKRAKLGDRGLLSSGLQDAHVPEVYTGNQARERGGGMHAICCMRRVYSMHWGSITLRLIRPVALLLCTPPCAHASVAGDWPSAATHPEPHVASLDRIECLHVY
jgi:hypothetical protein